MYDRMGFVKSEAGRYFGAARPAASSRAVPSDRCGAHGRRDRDRRRTALGPARPTFGGDGVVVRRLTDGFDVGRGVVALADGSVVVAADSGGERQAFHGPTPCS